MRGEDGRSKHERDINEHTHTDAETHHALELTAVLCGTNTDNMTWKTNEVQKGTERKQKCCVLLDVCLWVWTTEYPSNLCPTK